MKLKTSIWLLFVSVAFSAQAVTVKNQTSVVIKVKDVSGSKKTESGHVKHCKIKISPAEICPGFELKTDIFSLLITKMTVSFGGEDWIFDELTNESIILCSENNDGTINVDEF